MPVISRLSSIPFTPITIHLSQVEQSTDNHVAFSMDLSKCANCNSVMSFMRCIVEKYDCVFSLIIYVYNCKKGFSGFACSTNLYTRDYNYIISKFCCLCLHCDEVFMTLFRYVIKLAELTVLYYFHDSLSHKTSKHLIS